MRVNWTSTSVIIVYLGVSLAVGLYWGRRKTATSTEFAVSGREFGLATLFFTMLATIIGAASVIGYTGWYWTRGLSQLWFPVGSTVCFVLFIYYLGPRINEFGFQTSGCTVGDWLEYRYNSATRYIASVLLIIAYLAITAFQYMAMAKIISIATGFSYETGLIMSAVIVVVYTAMGGLWSVAATDVLQGSMTLLGLAILAPLVVAKAGGVAKVFSSVPAEHLDFFGYVTPVKALSYMLVFLLGIVSWPDIWQRCYAAKDTKTLRSSLWAYLIASLLITCVLVLLLGFAAKVLYPEYAIPENILFVIIQEHFPPVVGAFFLACLLAVVMGTADSTLLVCGVMFERDIYGKLINPGATDSQRLRVNRLATFIGGFLVLILAVTAPSMFDIWVWSADITGATLAIPILLGMAWKRPTGDAALAAIISGFIGWTAARLGWIGWDPIILGSLVSLAVYLLTAALMPQKSVSEART